MRMPAMTAYAQGDPASAVRKSVASVTGAD
jgi:hypothetical protein